MTGGGQAQQGDSNEEPTEPTATTSPLENIDVRSASGRQTVKKTPPDADTMPIAGPSTRDAHRGHNPSWPASTVFTYFSAVELADGSIRYRCSCTEEFAAKHPADLYLHLQVMHRHRAEAVLKADEALGYGSLSNALEAFRSEPRQRRPPHVIHVETTSADNFESELWKTVAKLDTDDKTHISHVQCLKCGGLFYVVEPEDIKTHLEHCDPDRLAALVAEDETARARAAARRNRGSWNLRPGVRPTRRGTAERETSGDRPHKQPRRRRDQIPEDSHFGQYCAVKGCRRLVAQHDTDKCWFCLYLDQEDRCLKCNKKDKLTHDPMRLCKKCVSQRVDRGFRPGDWTDIAEKTRGMGIPDPDGRHKNESDSSSDSEESQPATPQPSTSAAAIKREPISPVVDVTIATPRSSQQTPRRHRAKREQDSPRTMQPMHLQQMPILRELSPRVDTQSEDEDSAAAETRSNTPKSTRNPRRKASRRVELPPIAEDEAMDVMPDPGPSAIPSSAPSPLRPATSPRQSTPIPLPRAGPLTSAATSTPTRPIPTPRKLPRIPEVAEDTHDECLNPKKAPQ